MVPEAAYIQASLAALAVAVAYTQVSLTALVVAVAYTQELIVQAALVAFAPAAVA